MNITPKDIENPTRKSGYDHVNRSNGPAPRSPLWRAAGGGRGLTAGGGVGAAWRGPSRTTALEAAQDYCDYINGQPPRVVVHPGRSGRPDYMKVDGVMHMDLPGEAASGPSSPSKRRRTAPEREFMLRMEPVMEKIMRDDDMAEAKANIGRQAIATATGQLLMRRHETRKGRMFIVLPSEPSDTVKDFLRYHKIRLVTERGGTA